MSGGQIPTSDTEEFYWIDADTIGCRYGDCCIHRRDGMWHYASNEAGYPTPTEAYDQKNEDYK